MVDGMKAKNLLWLPAALALIGCGGEKPAESQKPAQTNKTETSASPLTAPADYAGAVGRALQVSKKVAGLTQVQTAVRQFQAGEGRLPASLNEVIQKGYLAGIPKLPPNMRLEYDPRTGAVKAVSTRP